MNIKEIIGNLKSKISRIFKSKETKQIEAGKDNYQKKFSEKLKKEHPITQENDIVDISALNSVIENNLKNRRNGTDYGLLRIISEKMATQIQIGDRQNNPIHTVYDKYATRETALDFFYSLDEELYRRADDIVWGDSEVDFRMYKLKSIKDFNNKDEDGFPEYSRFACVASNSNKTVLYMPLLETVKDVFVLVHEISHIFDLNNENVATNNARNMLAEVTAACFEEMLFKYLLDNKIINKKDIESREKAVFISKYDDSVETMAKLMLMDIKQNKGNITAEDIESLQKRYNLSKDSTRYVLDRLINSPDNVDYRAGYMISQLISPYFMKQYIENPKNAVERIKQYFEEVKNDNLKGALEKLGIKLDMKTLDLLIAENNIKIQTLQSSKKKEDETIR